MIVTKSVGGGSTHIDRCWSKSIEKALVIGNSKGGAEPQNGMLSANAMIGNKLYAHRGNNNTPVSVESSSIAKSIGSEAPLQKGTTQSLHRPQPWPTSSCFSTPAVPAHAHSSLACTWATDSFYSLHHQIHHPVALTPSEAWNPCTPNHDWAEEDDFANAESSLAPLGSLYWPVFIRTLLCALNIQ